MPPDRSLQPLLRYDGSYDPWDGQGPPSDPFDAPQRREAGLRRMGIWLFIASLAMLFGASLVGYLVIRLTNPEAPPAGFFDVPRLFYWSTAVLLAAGVTIELAARSRDDHRRRIALLTTAGLSVLFVALQTPALMGLFADHAQASARYNVGLYGLIFTLIVVHAAHVVGGLVPLAIITARQIASGPADASRPTDAAVRVTAIYWHFLDAVWLTMLLTFLLTR